MGAPRRMLVLLLAALGAALLAGCGGSSTKDERQPVACREGVGVYLNALRAAPGLSGGERRVLAVVAALIDEQPVEIVDVVSGLDRHHLDLVLAALAHAGGSHEHMSVVLDPDGAAHLSNPGPLHSWPTAESL